MRPRLKGAVLLLVAFLLGVAVGGLGMALYRARTGWWESPQGVARFQASLVRRLTRDLDLRPEQRQQVEAILREAGEQFARLREEIRPRYREIRTQTRERIRGLLDPDQRARFETLMERWDRQHQRWGAPTPPPADAPPKSP